MPRPIRRPKNNILFEYSPYSLGPQASSTPTQDPSNITWASDLSPIETSSPKKDTIVHVNTSPDPFGFKEIQGIRPTLKTKLLKQSLEKQKADNEKLSSDSSLSLENENSFQESSNEEEDINSPPTHRSTRTKKNLNYKEDSESDSNYRKKKKKYSRKHQNNSENMKIKEENTKFEKDTYEFDSKKQFTSSKSIIEYFKEVDKFKLDVEDIPANYSD
ncbi:hypothetical protein PORY_002456 [Pneumocystis oryctolagi]|uniref:Uncharacterized protein n=1 Tax=Pneumocystis oryctolagi TaxID=42067 RepID=A0ACB7CC75_9ASCO|nr:hypothetical protein PORY_002456 [Pneumocystis oryctolagi]